MASQINEFALESKKNTFIPRSLASPSHEQKNHIFIIEWKSVIDDAVAGNGKTTLFYGLQKHFKIKNC